MSVVVYDMQRMIRLRKRSLLRCALKGSRADRWNYAVSRVTVRHAVQGMVYGYAVADMDKMARRAWHWFMRLERLAARV